MKLTPIILTILTSIAMSLSAQAHKAKYDIDHMPVKACGSDMWSIINANGDIVYEDEFPGNGYVSSAINGYFIYRDNNGRTLYKTAQRPEVVADITNAYSVGFPSEGLIPVTSGDLKRIEYRYLDGRKAFTLNPVLGKEIRSVQNIFTDGLAVFHTDDLYSGAIAPSGKIVIAPNTYDYIHPFNEKLAVATISDENGTDREARYVVINTTGKIVFRLKPDEIPNRYFIDGKLVVNKKNGGAGYYDRAGSYHSFPPKAQEVKFIHGNKVFYSDKPRPPYRRPESVGVMDLDGNTLIKPQYNGIIPIDNNKFLAFKDNEKRTYLIDINGNIIKTLNGWVTPVPEISDNIIPIFTSDFSYMSEYPHNYLDANFNQLLPGDLGLDGVEDDNVDPFQSVWSCYFIPEKIGFDFASRVKSNGIGDAILGESADKTPAIINMKEMPLERTTINIYNSNRRTRIYERDVINLDKPYMEHGSAYQSRIASVSTILPTAHVAISRKYAMQIKDGAVNSLVKRGFAKIDNQLGYTILKSSNGNIAFIRLLSPDYIAIDLMPQSVWNVKSGELKQSASKAYNDYLEQIR